MRRTLPEILERGRLRGALVGTRWSEESAGWNGAFALRDPHGKLLRLVISDGGGWEHVSVSCEDRTPIWREMCWIKDLCWGPEETVIQYHPPKSEYVNCHPYCLHLWKPTGVEIPLPPTEFVGPKVWV